MLFIIKIYYNNLFSNFKLLCLTRVVVGFGWLAYLRQNLDAVDRPLHSSGGREIVLLLDMAM